MNTNEIKQYRQMKDLVEFGEQNQTKLGEDTTFTQVMTTINGIKTEFDNLIPVLGIKSKSETEEKQLSRNKLEKICFSLSGLLVSYGNLKSIEIFRNISGYTMTNLQRVPSEQVLLYAQKLQGICVDNAEDATLAGIDEEARTALSAAIADFDQKINDPQEFRIQHRELRKSINQKLEQYNDLLNNVLKLYMRSKYAESDAALYQDFLSSIEIPGSMVRTRAIQGIFTDTVNGKPIRRVRVSIDGQKPQVKGGEKGGYFIANLSPGMHEITFSRSAYITVVKKLVLLPDQPIVLDVAFTPVQIEEASIS